MAVAHTMSDMEQQGELLVTVDEYAALVGRHRSRISQLVREGRIASVRRGERVFIPRSEVERWGRLIRPTGGQPRPDRPVRVLSRKPPVKHTAELESAVLEAIRRTGSIKRACEEVGMSRITWHRWMRQDPELAEETTYALEASDAIEHDATCQCADCLRYDREDGHP